MANTITARARALPPSFGKTVDLPVFFATEYSRN
jgi:hypothetical protein